LVREREEKRRLLEGAQQPTGFLGTCQEMCPEFERYEREVHLDLSAFEMVAGSEVPRFPGDHPRIDHGRAVKKYHRPAAGNEMPLPEDVRPPPVLRRTMAYLVRLMEQQQGSLAAFAQLQKFVRDRTRSIRQDATLQQSALGVGNLDVIRVHEEIARFHVLSGHRLCELPKADFDAFQNTEQLRKVLQSLNEYYGDLRRHPELPQLPVAEEGEFRAYYLLTHLEDPDVFRKGFGWDAAVRAQPAVQLALSAGAAFHQGDYLAFFGLLRRAPSMLEMIGPGQLYLCLCLLHTHFSAMRWKAAKLLSKAYAPKDAIPVGRFADWLAFEDPPELAAFCEATGFALEGGFVRPQRALLEEAPLKPRRSDRFIEALVHGVSVSHIIQGDATGMHAPGMQAQFKPVAPQLPAQTAPLVPLQIAQQAPVRIAPPAPRLNPTMNGTAFHMPAQATGSVPVPLIIPAKTVEPVLAPVPLNIPVKPLATEPTKIPLPSAVQGVPKPPAFDLDALARLMFEGLQQSLVPLMVSYTAASTLDRYRAIDRGAQWLLSGLLGEVAHLLLTGIAKDAVSVGQGHLLDSLQAGLYDALLKTVTDGELLRLGEECLREAVVSEMRRVMKEIEPEPVDPLEAAYEAAALQQIKGGQVPAVPKKPAHPPPRMVERNWASAATAQGESKLKAGLRREREESLRYEEYLQSLLHS
jgi:hypothetical protein